MPAKVLFVDDEPDMETLISQRLRKKTRSGELELVFAQHGKLALEVLQKHPDVDVVMTDLNMPVMDGLALLAELKANYPLLATIVISAYSDMKNIRTAMNCGAFDFLTKPIESQDLELTLERSLSYVAKSKADLQIKQMQEAELRKSEAYAKEKALQLSQTLEQLEQAQLQLVQNEKMSVLGQMIAGIAHEMNNPINFVSGNLKYVRDYAQDLVDLIKLYQESYPEPTEIIRDTIEKIELDFLMQDLLKTTDSMQVGSERIQRLVVSLRNFSRLDDSLVDDTDLHEGIDSTLLILSNRIKQGISISKQYGTLPKIECYPSQLNQVFMNLLGNAIDALLSQPEQSKKVIVIRTEVNNEQVSIRIRDNGPGIPSENKDKIFQPFFTTKPVGQGTGLGLPICRQIIEKHQGTLEVISEPNEGTEFVITLPIKFNKQIN